MSGKLTYEEEKAIALEKKKKISKTKKTKAQENKYMKLTNPILATCFDSNEKKLNELIKSKTKQIGRAHV